MSALLLTAAEARVIAALVEKSIATPQYYPMSVNALMLAANQKTCRAPVMNLSEGDVGAALNHLEELKLVSRDPLSARVTKWRHSFQHQLLLKPETLALLVTLMLRGPQTLLELKANASGIGGPAEAEAATTALQDLSDRAHPLVVLLPRAPGRKEARYAHTLCGEVALEDPGASVAEAPPASVAATGLAALEQRVEALELRLAELERRLPG
ncbi:MAG TPA: DUF480 domain-containing protein [Nevskiaceae bacterium]|nr:DUF480 domain-containing protein [Nevskiaceae bacterium]